jgi:hypothetical protein
LFHVIYIFLIYLTDSKHSFHYFPSSPSGVGGDNAKSVKRDVCWCWDSIHKCKCKAQHVLSQRNPIFSKFVAYKSIRVYHENASRGVIFRVFSLSRRYFEAAVQRLVDLAVGHKLNMHGKLDVGPRQGLPRVDWLVFLARAEVVALPRFMKRPLNPAFSPGPDEKAKLLNIVSGPGPTCIPS